MSTHRVHRLLRLISLLQSGESFTAEQLAEELGVSRRTFFRDLNVLELAGVPYHYQGKQRTYAIEPSFLVSSLSLTRDEAIALLLAAQRFASPESLPVYEAANRAAAKLESGFPPTVRELSRATLDGVTVKLPPLVDAGRIEEVFTKMHRALAERRKVRMQYDSYFEGRAVETLASPYRILFENRAWYLVGHSSLHGETRTFKLDRITSAEPLEERFEPDPDFSLDDYFGLAWRMIPEGKVYHVRLRFLPKVAGNVEEISWHKTQRFTAEPDGSCIFEAEVDGLGEITWWILGYGDQVIVEEPPELRDRIGRIAANMCRLADATELPP